MERETVGKISYDLQQKEPDQTDAIELEREMHKDYVANVYECMERGKKQFPHTDFFIIVCTKKERLMQNVLRNYFFPRQSCPSPEWDQTVYRYSYEDDDVHFLWVVPSKDTCELLRDNALKVADEERDLLKFVLDFEDGTLLRRSKVINRELQA